MDILIKNMVLPTENEQVNITILSDGSVIEHFRNESGKWHSYRSVGIEAIKLPPHGELIERIIPNYDDFQKNYQEYFNDNMSLNSAHIAIIDIINNAPTILEANK